MFKNKKKFIKQFKKKAMNIPAYKLIQNLLKLIFKISIKTRKVL